MWKYENLWKAPMTTAIGVGLVVYALTGLWLEKFEWETAGPILAAGLWGLGMKDPNSGSSAGSAPVVMLLLLLMAGCRTPKITSTHEVKDSTFVRVQTRIDTLILPGAEIPYRVYVNCDSLGKPFLTKTKAGAAERHFNFTNGEAFNEMSFDPQTGALDGYAGCDSLERVIERQDSTIFRLRFERTGTTVERVERVTPIWAWLVMGAMGMVILAQTLKGSTRL